MARHQPCLGRMSCRGKNLLRKYFLKLIRFDPKNMMAENAGIVSMPSVTILRRYGRPGKIGLEIQQTIAPLRLAARMLNNRCA